ncbi:MAG: AAA domain-containing protein, partial [Sedimentibacter sp.]
ENKSEIYSMNIDDVYEKIKNCMNLELLEDWLDYTITRKKCVEYGLTDFIEKVEKLNLHGNDISNTFQKRFYKLWLDETLLKYPAVYSFRSRTQQFIIDDFNDLDKLQLEIARLRIREKLIANLPDMDVTTSSLDEVGILKRELSKQRRIMPLRQLFKLMPNLLTTLKPCLMMSPLSVSLYLQEDGFLFDTVIFDEASQICTENAIGAIIRGKQVIIAGDRYQLPPTNFFNTAYSDNVLDAEDEDTCEDIDEYDSILDEAANAIPERTLKWHYRSRYENLIAFSNEKIYKNELTTFPSNIRNFKDCGVEYIYVEDGIYNRGTQKNNVNEARRVARLVFEHFNQYPDRSLGVVTFSAAQQQAIENSIRHRRLLDPSYEKFFAEDRDNDFFVKNLENVQGDERDTIIFSIGYGKDSNGVMYMNFGPLSRKGGYRRLNVAITRAKFNLKLVGSILPEDINMEKTNSEGLRMLRNYIEFAMNDSIFLQNKLTPDNEYGLDSPFEQAVYEFLTKNGYLVKTKVGCSGYRIDMAVEHPVLSGAFVLCIECDGPIYHSARTARERDRLRQSVLEDMGWTIYRVWSTDWVKDTKIEGYRLLQAVEKAISDFKTDVVKATPQNQLINPEY